MTSWQLRQKYLDFFEKNGHKIIPSASLMPSEEEQLEGKEKILFTSAGMQPLIPYLTGKVEPPSKRLVDCQKCLRTDDIEEVGDLVHHTFFEMLGNWSIGDYWKKETIEMSFEFLTKELNIPIKKLAVSVFEGDKDTPRDEESAEVWQNLGIPKERIFYFGKEHNWWPTGPSFGPCGPDTEMFYWAGEAEQEGKPNENSSWVEIWNDVFMQFNRKEDRTLEPLPQRNVDTGMGLERTLAVLNLKKSAYETDIFEGVIKELERRTNKIYGQNSDIDKSFRIISDHLRAASMLIIDGVIPSNKTQGYVLRRLLRRSMFHGHLVGLSLSGAVYPLIIKEFQLVYPEITESWSVISDVIDKEGLKFGDSLDRGLKKLERTMERIEDINSLFIFDLYQSYGFPYELSKEILSQKNIHLTEENLKGFEEAKRGHQELSRIAAGKFSGGLSGHSDIETKYHTATHLLHQALRDVFGEEVFQKGSNITPERLRFDFSFDRRMTDKEIKKVEDLVNQKIKEDLQVDKKIMSLEEARKLNAIGLFDEKYSNEVSIYAMGPNYEYDPDATDKRERGGYYSLEFCGGPHVGHTGQVGGIKITKEKAVSAGMRRIRAELVKQ